MLKYRMFQIKGGKISNQKINLTRFQQIYVYIFKF